PCRCSSTASARWTSGSTTFTTTGSTSPTAASSMTRTRSCTGRSRSSSPRARSWTTSSATPAWTTTGKRARRPRPRRGVSHENGHEQHRTVVRRGAAGVAARLRARLGPILVRPQRPDDARPDAPAERYRGPVLHLLLQFRPALLRQSAGGVAGRKGHDLPAPLLANPERPPQPAVPAQR